MAGDGNLATTAIITNGLTCGHGPLDPCKHGLMTTPFSLYCTGVVPPPKPSFGGGPYPRDAWNKFNPGDIKNFYQPVPEQYYIVPRDQEARFFRRYKMVKIVLKLGEFTSEKEYNVPEKRAKIIIKAFNILEVSKNQIDIAVNEIKRVVSDITIKVRKLRLRKK